ncbi:uncharacterized protein LOC103936589 [Pyrus x bretschneideri]|uniref:uncharacterized protein LOC103936589 n=1 Tax=Pyrus x bretschneideri TaxID=225117 RepID=UPI00202DEFEF|nr:uncharacterized protein LOC103936589 [Pyrus x bretschneideri]
MTLYANNDALMCKIFTTMLQGEAQDGFYTLPPHSIWNFSKLFLVFTKEYSSYRWIKKKSDHLFNMKNDLNESLHIYVKWFKAKIIGYDDSITCSALWKGLPADHSFFRELIIGENLTLSNSYALAEKHSIWNEEKCSQKLLKQPYKDTERTQKKTSDKLLNDKNKTGSRRTDRSSTKGGSAPKTYTKFLVLINQIFRDLKDKPWFKLPPPIKRDPFKIDQTKYCSFHKGLRHTTNDCTMWKRYLE